jgi:hypothetical protein
LILSQDDGTAVSNILSVMFGPSARWAAVRRVLLGIRRADGDVDATTQVTRLRRVLQAAKKARQQQHHQLYRTLYLAVWARKQMLPADARSAVDQLFDGDDRKLIDECNSLIVSVVVSTINIIVTFDERIAATSTVLGSKFSAHLTQQLRDDAVLTRKSAVHNAATRLHQRMLEKSWQHSDDERVLDAHILEIEAKEDARDDDFAGQNERRLVSCCWLCGL